MSCIKKTKRENGTSSTIWKFCFRMENSSAQQDAAGSKVDPFLTPNLVKDKKDISDKNKKSDLKIKNSATSLLVQNTILLPSSVVRVKQSYNNDGVEKLNVQSTSSGSATGK